MGLFYTSRDILLSISVIFYFASKDMDPWAPNDKLLFNLMVEIADTIGPTGGVKKFFMDKLDNLVNDLVDILVYILVKTMGEVTYYCILWEIRFFKFLIKNYTLGELVDMAIINTEAFI